MGFQTSAHFGYGFQIPDTDPNELEDKMGALDNEVSFLSAGHYDREHTFLVTWCTEADLGSHEVVTPQSFTPEQYEAWNAQLGTTATALGLDKTPEPGWLIVPSVS